MIERRMLYRAVFAALVLSSAAYVAAAYVSAVGEREGADAIGSIRGHEYDRLTVVSGQPTPHKGTALVVFDGEGNRITTYEFLDNIGDIDPVPNERYTIVYVGSEKLDESECDSRTWCVRNVIGRFDLATGERTELYSHVDAYNRLADGVTSASHSVNWHDVDRIDRHRFLVADIAEDRVFVVNVTSKIVEWEWEVQSHYATSSGGQFPYDWTHLNDVEYLEKGWVMVSLRNQDQVAFVDPDRGIRENWTLGADDDHEILYEQHNPDYIPAERGGPAILVADSENNRVIEYRRTDRDAWNRSWVWEGPGLQWPRDADRLPNGHTLVTDSHGNRVFEVDERGTVVWNGTVVTGYDAERLGTGDESAGGPSAARASLASRSAGETGGGSAGWSVVDLVPRKVLHGLLFVFPWWMSFRHIVVTLGGAGAAVVWMGLELYWWQNVGIRSPVYWKR